MEFIKLKNIIPAAALVMAVGLSSCTGDLDVTPIDPNLTLETSEAKAFVKCYANLGMESRDGANGSCDIDGYDGGTTGFIRQIFNANELTTDESICGWGDEGISDFVNNSYTAAHPMLEGLYYRLFYGVSMCNDYLYAYEGQEPVHTAEVRFLRALYYYELMDLYGNVAIITQSAQEEVQYQQNTRAEVFNFVESELLAVAGEAEDNSAVLSDPSAKIANEATRENAEAGYGRADKAAAWLLLSRLYLNSEVYTGNAQWDKAAAYAKKVIDSPYKLFTGGNGNFTSYEMLFMGDNGSNGASCEAILPILQDGRTTSAWAGTLFLIASTTKSDMGSFGTSEYWAGNRARPEFVAKFFPKAANTPYDGVKATQAAAGDDRALLFGAGDGRTLENTSTSDFTHGFSVAKWTNVYSNGGTPHNSQFVDTDMFFLRAAEAYLNYAEALARQNGNVATAGKGKEQIDAIRQRANTTTQDSYTLSDILDEWSREFYYEGRRRMDLVRFGQYGGPQATYKWAWKGGSLEGTTFDSHLNIFAIPATEINASSGKIKQNPGY